MSEKPVLKPAYWAPSTKEDLRTFPRPARTTIGQAIRAAQLGDKHEAAKPLRGFKGAGVLEVVEDHRGDTYRAVYTVRFKDAVYVLHVFKKKSKKGIKTPKHVMDLIRARLRDAEREYREEKKGQ